MLEKLPVVDFAKAAVGSTASDDELIELGDQIYDAFANVGFVYLKNTGISRKAIDRMYATAGKFWNMDYETKMKCAQDHTLQGYLGIEHEKLNTARPGDYKECFDVRGQCLEDDNANWPSEEFKTEVRDFTKICRQLTMNLLKVIAIGMRIKDKEYFMRGHSRINTTKNYSSFRMLHYPPLPEEIEIKPRQIRLGEHTDYGSLTLLFQDNVGGLEVQRYDGEFIEATPIPDTIVVNIGDAMNYWTRGQLKSTTHRIVNPSDPVKRRTERNSMAFFAHADFDVLLSGLEYGIESLNKQKLGKEFEAITAFEHAMRKYKATLGSVVEKNA